MDIMKLLDWLPHHKLAVATDAIALVAISTPWWLSELQEISGVFALLFPIAGTFWLAVQIAAKVYVTWIRKAGSDGPQT